MTADAKANLELTISVYGFGFALALISIVPGLNMVLFSGHGGPGWLLLPFALPYALCRLIQTYRKAAADRRPFLMKFGITSVVIYAALSGGAAMAGAWAISRAAQSRCRRIANANIKGPTGGAI
jgi:hypothetical protein